MSYADFANAICHKLQKSAQEMVQARITANGLESLLPTANVFAGIGKTGVTSKRVVCECKRAVPAEPWEGNWMADLKIRVICPYKDISEDGFHELSGQIFAFFFQEPATVCTRLSNATIKVTAQFIVPRGCGWDVVDDSGSETDRAGAASWESEHDFQVLCSGSVIE